jgi:anaerobic selenocysteine-containing dehydrogenase
MGSTYAPHAMSSTRTVARQCTLCEAHCGILVTVENDRVTRIEGDPEDVLSRGYICPKATALADLHHDPERLRRPVRRVGDGFEEISWPEAFDLVGANLRRIQKRHGRSAVAMYLGNPAAHSPSVIYGILLRAALLTRHFYTASSVDQFPQEFAAWQMFGSNAALPVADIDRTDRLVIIGANPVVSNGSLTTMPNAKGRIRAVRERGGSVVVIDPRRTETARLADEHVSVRPGGDPYLLLGMLHVLFADGLEPSPHLRDRVTGWDAVRALVETTTPEQMATHAGVDAATIRRLARDHAAADSAVVYGRIGVCQHVTGTVTHWLINLVNAVTGNLDRPGGHMFTSPPVDLAAAIRHVTIPWGNWTDRSGTRKAFRWELPSAGLADDILEPGDDQIRAMICYAGNPVLSHPHRDRLDEALASLDFFVAVDLYVTETSRHADLILPPVSQLERAEFDVIFPALGVRNNARYNARVFDPPDDGLEDWEILARILLEVVPLPMRGLVGGLATMGVEQLSPERLSALAMAISPHGVLRKGLGGLTLRKIKSTRGGVDLGALEPRLDKVLGTKDRRVHLAPPLVVDEARRLVDRATAGSPADAPPDGYDLRLIGRRHLRSNNSWMHNVPAMVKGRDRCTALLHPDDAEARGLSNRQPVRVTSPVGSIEVPLEISDEIRPGTVAIPHGWGHDEKGVGWSTAAANPGANVNRLIDPDLADPLSGEIALNGTWVRVEDDLAVSRRPTLGASSTRGARMEERQPTPDEIEQRRLADGSYEEEDAEDLDIGDDPADPDVIEQHQVVEYDEDDYRD